MGIVSKSISIPEEISTQIEKISKIEGRCFSSQIAWMCRKYIEAHNEDMQRIIDEEKKDVSSLIV